MFRWFAKKVHSAEDATFGWLRRKSEVLHAGILAIGGVVTAEISIYLFLIVLGILAAWFFISEKGKKYKKEDGEL